MNENQTKRKKRLLGLFVFASFIAWIGLAYYCLFVPRISVRQVENDIRSRIAPKTSYSEVMKTLKQMTTEDLREDIDSNGQKIITLTLGNCGAVYQITGVFIRITFTFDQDNHLKSFSVVEESNL